MSEFDLNRENREELVKDAEKHITDAWVIYQTQSGNYLKEARQVLNKGFDLFEELNVKPPARALALERTLDDAEGYSREDLGLRE